MVRALDQSAACMIVAVVTPRAAAQVAAAALVEPAVSPVPASLSTKGSHLATLKRAAARNGGTQVSSSTLESKFRLSVSVTFKYADRWLIGHKLACQCSW